jgi:hypothetical protein
MARLTSSVSSDSVDLFLHAHLEESSVARLANAAVTTMPGSSYDVPSLPAVLRALAQGDHLAYVFVPTDQLVDRAEMALLDVVITAADSAVRYADQELALLGLLEGELLDLPVGSGLVNNAGPVRLWERLGGHVGDGSSRDEE